MNLNTKRYRDKETSKVGRLSVLTTSSLSTAWSVSRSRRRADYADDIPRFVLLQILKIFFISKGKYKRIAVSRQKITNWEILTQYRIIMWAGTTARVEGRFYVSMTQSRPFP